MFSVIVPGKSIADLQAKLLQPGKKGPGKRSLTRKSDNLLDLHRTSLPSSQALF